MKELRDWEWKCPKCERNRDEDGLFLVGVFCLSAMCTWLGFLAREIFDFFFG